MFRFLLCSEELYFSGSLHFKTKALQSILITNNNLLAMHGGFLKWRFTCVNHTFCGKMNNTTVFILVYFVGLISLARWPIIHLVFKGSYAKVPKILYISKIYL